MTKYKMRNSLLSIYVDEIGDIKATIASLTQREQDLKDFLIASGETEIEGDLFRVTISETERESLDMAKVRAFLTDAQLFECTRLTHVTTVRCNAKTRKG